MTHPSVPSIDLEPRPEDVHDTGDHTFLADSTVDTLARVVIQLAAALWIQRDRTRVLEDLLVQAGVLADKAVDEYQPSTDRLQSLLKERDAFVAELLSPILAAANLQAGQ